MRPTRRVLVALFVALLAQWARVLPAQCVQGSFEPGRIFKSTGDPALDQKFNIEGNYIFRAFGVNPNMFVFDDSGSPNAIAVPDAQTLQGYTGSVFFGRELLRDELWASEKGEAAVAGIMAHEFAHILQAKNGSRLRTPARELHADYMAGYYLGRKAYLVPSGVENFAKSLFEKGDYNFTSPQHHGTPEQRVAALQAGYSNATASLAIAYRNGENFVRELVAGETVAGGAGTDANLEPSRTEGGADFCASLDSVMEAAASNFSTLKGQRDPSDHELFHATLSLPGARSCEVATDGLYSCEMYMGDDVAAAKAIVENVVRRIQQCDESWKVEPGRSTSKFTMQEVRLVAAGANGDISVSRKRFSSRILVDVLVFPNGGW